MTFVMDQPRSHSNSTTQTITTSTTTTTTTDADKYFPEEVDGGKEVASLSSSQNTTAEYSKTIPTSTLSMKRSRSLNDLTLLSSSKKCSNTTTTTTTTLNTGHKDDEMGHGSSSSGVGHKDNNNTIIATKMELFNTQQQQQKATTTTSVVADATDSSRHHHHHHGHFSSNERARLISLKQATIPLPFFSSGNDNGFMFRHPFGGGATKNWGHRARKRRISGGAKIVSDSETVCGGGSVANKRRRRTSDRFLAANDDNFLLGGNVSDPLNLNALLTDSELSKRLNDKTPVCSPLPKINKDNIEVMVPKDLTDPLNLNSGDDSAEIKDSYISPLRNLKKKRQQRLSSRQSRNLEITFDDPQQAIWKDSVEADGRVMMDTARSVIPPKDTTENIVPSNIKSLVEQKKTLTIDIVSTPQACSEVARSTAVAATVTTPSAVPVTGATPQQSTKYYKAENVVIVSPVTISPKNKTSLTTKTDVVGGGASNTNHHPGRAKPTVDTEISNSSKSKPPRKTPEKQKRRSHDKKQRHKNTTAAESDKKVNFNDKNKRFQYGNYSRYYGYRNPDMEEDERLKAFKREWFDEKSVLDIGCNIGHISFSIAKKFNASNVTGVDIDGNLIGIARKNIRHYLTDVKNPTSQDKFPDSLHAQYGPLAMPSLEARDSVSKTKFPYNIFFRQENYVPVSDVTVDCQKPEYDVILLLSTSKWLHLNFGDEGLKRTFKRIYNHLRPGGRFILEPQQWPSYGKKKKLTETIYKNYTSIKLKPQQFCDYLLSKNVGFKKAEVVAIPFNKSKGFQRPILMFIKN